MSFREYAFCVVKFTYYTSIPYWLPSLLWLSHVVPVLYIFKWWIIIPISCFHPGFTAVHVYFIWLSGLWDSGSATAMLFSPALPEMTYCVSSGKLNLTHSLPKVSYYQAMQVECGVACGQSYLDVWP